MAAHKIRLDTHPEADRPAVDEWGIYDPSQAGLEVVFERLEAKRRAAGDVDAKGVASSMRDANRLADAATGSDAE